MFVTDPEHVVGPWGTQIFPESMPGIHTIIMWQNIGFLVLRDPEMWDSVFHVMEVEIFCKMIGGPAVGSGNHQPGMGQF